VVQWGDVPTWVSAVATLTALVFAAVAAIYAGRAYRIESERDKQSAGERRDRAELQRRAQATLVSAWWGTQNRENDSPQWGVFIRNASSTPVYENMITITRFHDPEVGDTFEIPVVPPTSQPTFHRSEIWSEGVARGVKPAELRVEVMFTDSAGVRWVRDKQGRLFEVLPELTIWTDSLRAKTLESFSSEFLADHNVTVTFQCPTIEDLHDDFLAAVATGEAPDVLICPHDWIAELAEQKLIDPIELPEQRRNAFNSKAIGAMMWKGKLWGVPYAADTVALLRNLDLAPEPPVTAEDLFEQGWSLCGVKSVREPMVIQVGSGDAFHIHPWFSSLGGRLLARAGESWDIKRMTASTSESAYVRLASLGEQGSRVLRREISREEAIRIFSEGATPFMIAAPWAMEPARSAGVRLGVSDIPPFSGGGPARSLIAVHGFCFPSSGKNKAVARQLVFDFLTKMKVARALYDAQPRPPALTAAFETFYASDDEATPFRDQFLNGDLIPSTPDMAAAWRILNRAQRDVIGGVEVGGVLRDMARRLAQLNGEN
jgi:arabinogalactan oligomer / maltooligosaccharide transport system substrate-binding protein